jgi:hypothetical protein
VAFRIKDLLISIGSSKGHDPLHKGLIEFETPGGRECEPFRRTLELLEHLKDEMRKAIEQIERGEKALRDVPSPSEPQTKADIELLRGKLHEALAELDKGK